MKGKKCKQNADNDVLPEEQFIPEKPQSMPHRRYKHHDLTRYYKHVKNKHKRKQKN